eukprot:CAMPEP_0168557480 /NCGR_PEP_ID=MMETSP0413-20121227/9450_1 /TAXON_ID=136452 /ORGANISM="Filamoeba nolandi, Strain NC-AS-23-1" /LENGTH=391 /DNA_ID=CAMNT_0008588519 /DNA_START=136 /DNA_END=1311 /DNA_ORIENTATION=+
MAANGVLVWAGIGIGGAVVVLLVTQSNKITHLFRKQESDSKSESSEPRERSNSVGKNDSNSNFLDKKNLRKSPSNHKVQTLIIKSDEEVKEILKQLKSSNTNSSGEQESSTSTTKSEDSTSPSKTTSPSSQTVRTPLTRSASKSPNPINYTRLLTDTQRIWSKEFHHLPVAIDLLRLCKSMAIFDSRSESKHASQSFGDAKDLQKTKEEQMLSVLLQLARILEPEKEESIQKNFPTYLQKANSIPGMDVSKDVVAFLRDVVGADSHIVNILKACNQSIIAPLVTQLRLEICPQLKFKDGGSWKIHVVIQDDCVKIIHLKNQKQMRLDSNPSEFEFEWELEIQLTRDTNQLTTVSFKVPQLLFNEHTTEETKKQMYNIFTPYLTQPTTPTVL